MMGVVQLAFSSLGINFGTQPTQPSTAERSNSPTPPQSSKPNESKIEPMETETEPELLSPEEKKKKDAASAKDRGNGFYKKRKFEQAISEYSKAIDLDPESPIYLTNRSAVYFMTEQYDRCVDDCNEAIKLTRKNYGDFKLIAKAYARMGDVEMKRGSVDSAIELYNKSLVEDQTYTLKKKLKLAINKKKEIEAMAYINPEIALQHKEKGNEHFKNSNWQDAIDEYTESIKRNPEDGKVYSNRAAAYLKLMAWEYALKDCEKSIEIDPTFAKAYLRKGRIHHFTKEYKKAMDTYNKGLEYEPNSQQFLNAKRQTMQAISMSATSGEVDEEQTRRAMADPDVQNIMRDPHTSLGCRSCSNRLPQIRRYFNKRCKILIRVRKLKYSSLLESYDLDRCDKDGFSIGDLFIKYNRIAEHFQ